jgi:hypothetical protein
MAPVVVLLASHSESVVPETESPFASPPIEKLPLLSVSITSHCSLSDRTFPFPERVVEVLLSWVNLRPESPPVPELISNFASALDVPIPTFPFSRICTHPAVVDHGAIENTHDEVVLLLSLLKIIP